MNFVARYLYYIFFIRYEGRLDFWCWSRRDYNEIDLRQLPITLNFREEEFLPFTTSFFYNQTSRSIKCNSSEEWADNWVDVSSNFYDPENIPCPTNVGTVGYFDWDRFPQKM